MTAGAYHLFGVNEWAARLWPALTGFVGAIMAWLVLRRHLGEASARIAALFVLCSPYYVFFSQVLTLDIGVSFFISTGMLLFVRAQCEVMNTAAQRHAMLAAWACMALGVLSKGLIGFALPTMVVGIYVLVQRDWALLRRMQWIPGLLTFALIAVPWFVVVSQRNPEFAHFFFIHEHFARYTSAVHNKTEPFWFFFPILLVGLLPWTWLALEGVREGWRRSATASGFRVERFLVMWVVCVVGFFSLSASKLHGYVLPVVVPLAILAAQRAAALDARALMLRMIPAMVLFGVLAFGGGEAMRIAQEDSPTYLLYSHYALWLEGAGIGLTCLAALVAVIGPRVRWLSMACVGSLTITVVSTLGFENVSAIRSAKSAALAIRAHLSAKTQMFQVGRYDHGLSYYLRTPSRIADVGGELDFGLQQEPQFGLPTPEAFELAWNAAPAAIALMSQDSFKKFSGRGLKFDMMYQDAKRVVVKRPD